MRVRQLSHELKSRPQFTRERVRIILADVQATALRRAANRKGSNDEMATDAYCPGGEIHILPAVLRVSQEVKYCTIMPDVAGAQLFDLADVSGNPMNLVGLGTQTCFGMFQRNL
jgi:hypothetical protein